MKGFLSLPLVMLAVAFLTACGGGASAATAKDLVPVNANFMAQVQVEKLLQDIDFQTLYHQAPKGPDEPQTLDDLLDEAQEETGVDFRQFSAALLFGDVSRDEEYFGAIAQGQVSEDQVISAIEESGEYVMGTVDYAGQRVYVDQGDEDGPAIAFLDDDTLVLGTLPAVQDVIDVHQGNLDRASGKLYDTFTSLGEPLFSMAMEVPPDAMQELEDSIGGGQGFGMMPALDAFGDLDIISLVVDKPGSDLKVEATLEFFSAQSATEMSNTLDGFLKLAAGFAPDEGVRALLDKLQLSVDGARLTINFQAPVSEIREVARGLEQDLGGQY